MCILNVWRKWRKWRYNATITRKLNAIYSKEDSQLDPVIARLQALTLERNTSPEDFLFDIPPHLDATKYTNDATHQDNWDNWNKQGILADKTDQQKAPHRD